MTPHRVVLQALGPCILIQSDFVHYFPFPEQEGEACCQPSCKGRDLKQKLADRNNSSMLMIITTTTMSVNRFA